ncbi:hypothetical protein AVEN_91397-1 [Araneus ventricosus]|uniref:Uncharacterized protein n=1 Tax=Araneus ventricosus TaxID=182803 RepID=A0A4Y2KFH3_ARAVE|nr:hypothetical protein AVEN_91397-1 [Araneus ventricosus]
MTRITSQATDTVTTDDVLQKHINSCGRLAVEPVSPESPPRRQPILSRKAPTSEILDTEILLLFYGEKARVIVIGDYIFIDCKSQIVVDRQRTEARVAAHEPQQRDVECHITLLMWPSTSISSSSKWIPKSTNYTPDIYHLSL